MRRWVCVTLVGAVGMLTTPVAAQGVGGQPEEYAPTMLVLDASGSMAEASSGGATKMAAAKQATRAVIDSAPDGSRMGLTVYGSRTGSSEAEKAAGCRDVTVLRKVAEVDKAGLNAAVDRVTPRGYTPIGTALRTAADSLPREGPRAVVLVSDGEDTCAPPDPCEVARGLDQQGAELVVHAVGFGVDDKARAQLTCVAQSSGGTYTDAPDATSLEDILPRVVATALRNYQADGIPVTGADKPEAAPEVTPGQYLDTIGKKEARYYALDVPQGATAYVAATVSFRRATGVQDINRLDIQPFGHTDGACPSSASELVDRSGDGEALAVSLTFAGAAEPGGEDCTGGGRYVFLVSWAEASDSQPSRLPVELLFGLEPEVSGDPGPAPASEVIEYANPGGPPRPVTGGGSFGTAATLDGAGHYTDVVRPGEYVFYRIRLDWGQALAYRLRYADVAESSRFLANISSTLYTPFRGVAGSSSGAYNGYEQYLIGPDSPIATAPVRYRNRDADTSDLQVHSVAGWYYIAVKLGLPQGQGGAAVPVTLSVSVDGSPQDGPEYRFDSAEQQDAGVFGDGKPKGDKASSHSAPHPKQPPARTPARSRG
jgi:Ca-activated chloride channel family protein